jgi:8-amino-7-oxononanoate synthase
LQGSGWKVPDGDSPIVPVIVGDNAAALRWHERLLQADMFVPAIRPPTVPEGTARLRISLSALHTREQLERLVSQLNSR